MPALCIPFGAEFGAAYWVNHLVTGLSYFAIMTLLLTSVRGIVRRDYETAFAIFIGCCGAHHLACALGAPIIATTVIDAATALVSFATTSFLLVDFVRDRLHRRGG